TLTHQLGKDRADRGTVHLAIDLLREAAWLGRERDTTADKDRSRQCTVTRTAALLLLGFLGRTADFRARLLCLGTGAGRVAIGNNHLMHQILTERATEDLVRDRQRVAAVVDGQFHCHAPLL